MNRWASLILVGLSAGGLCVAQSGPNRTSKELFDYIHEARKLGLNDEQIQKNARSAGWDQETVDQTYSIVRLMNNERPDRFRLAMPEGYRIGAGDVLSVLVWKEPEASAPEVVVRADGNISLPLIKELHVAGLTPRELETELTGRMGKLINGADVTVTPKQIRSMRIYVVGAVKKEGAIPLTGPLTVLQALTEAGGLTDYAKRKKIYILRNENGKQVKLPFDYQAVLQGERIEQNVMVKPDDTIVVPN